MPILDDVKVAAQRVVRGVRTARAGHLARHRPSGFAFALFDSIRFVRAEHWDGLVAGHSVCLGRAYLETLEENLPANIRPHYALIYRGAEPVAAVAAQAVEIAASSLPGKPLGGLARRSLAGLKERVLVCGNLLSWGPHGTAFAPGVPPLELWPAVAEALYRIRRSDRLFGETGLVMVKDLPDPDPAAAEALRRFSYRPFETEPDMVIPLDPAWTTFQDFLAGMKSGYRNGVKKQLRDFEAAGLVLETLDPDQVEAHADEIHGLYLQVHQRQKLRLMTISPGWIPALARRFGEDFRVHVARSREGGPLLGFITWLRDGEGSIGYYIGFDRAAAEGAPLYLRLLYAAVEDALQSGAAWISLGRTALSPKAQLGGRPRPLQCFLRHRIQATNLIVRSLLHALPEPAEAPERNPFK